MLRNGVVPSFSFKSFSTEKNLMHLRLESPEWIVGTGTSNLLEQKIEGKARLSRETRRKTERHAFFSSSSHLGKNGGVAYCWTSKYILQTDLGKSILFMSGFPSPSFSLFNGRGLKSKEFSILCHWKLSISTPKRRSSSFPMGMAVPSCCRTFLVDEYIIHWLHHLTTS